MVTHPFTFFEESLTLYRGVKLTFIFIIFTHFSIIIVFKGPVVTVRYKCIYSLTYFYILASV